MKKPTDEGRLGVLSLLDRPTGNVGIELGVAAGDFSVRLLESGRFDRLYGVDAYADHHEVNEYKLALRRLGLSGGYTLLRMFFDEALELFEDNSLDFVYIDGYAHTGQKGGETIFAWASKVKPGGVVSGHDYDPAFPLTIEAVDWFVAENGFELCIVDLEGAYPSWAVRKTTETIIGGPTPGLRRAARNARFAAGLRRVVAAPIKRFLGGGGENREYGKHSARGLY